MKVSIIIPVYNAANTLRNCFDSIVRQTINDKEIIFIDDGSSDTSWEIMNGYAANFSNVVLLKQEHQGAGEARNLGIREAKGKYIVFLDADDEFEEKHALSSMYNACIRNEAKICGSYRRVVENGRECESLLFEDLNVSEEGEFIDFKDFQHDYDYQSFIFDREFLLENNIFFPPYKRYQDPPFFLKAMAKAQKFYMLPIVLYKYYYSSGKDQLLRKNMEDILMGIKDTLVMSKEYGYESLFGKIIVRVDSQFKDVILSGLNDNIMQLILQINTLSIEECGYHLSVLEQIYDTNQYLLTLSKSYDLMKKIVLIKQKENAFTRFFASKKIKRVVVYGIGEFGRLLLKELDICGVEIISIIDRSVEVYENFKIIKPDESLPKCDALIISLVESESVFNKYKENKDLNVYTFEGIITSILVDCHKG